MCDSKRTSIISIKHLRRKNKNIWVKIRRERSGGGKGREKKENNNNLADGVGDKIRGSLRQLPLLAGTFQLPINEQLNRETDRERVRSLILYHRADGRRGIIPRFRYVRFINRVFRVVVR